MNRRQSLFPMIVLTLVTVLTIGCGCGLLPSLPIPISSNTPTPAATSMPVNTPMPAATSPPVNTPTPTPLALPTVKEFLISTNGKQSQPSISGDYVVWAHYRGSSGLSQSRPIDIYAYDLSTGRETLITTKQQSELYALVAGDLVVWLRNSWFYGYRLGAEDTKEFNITRFGSLIRVLGVGKEGRVAYICPYLALSERAIAWASREAQDIDILAFDLERDTEIQITDDDASQAWPAAAGSFIVWADKRDDGGDIYAYDLDTQKEFPIVTGHLTQTMPSTDGQHVVWIDERDGNKEVYGYNLETRTEFPIVTGPAERILPVVWGDFVIWMQEDDADWNIYGYDLRVGEEFPIVTEEGRQEYPRIWGNTVVWGDSRDQGSIHGATLER